MYTGDQVSYRSHPYTSEKLQNGWWGTRTYPKSSAVLVVLECHLTLVTVIVILTQTSVRYLLLLHQNRDHSAIERKKEDTEKRKPDSTHGYLTFHTGILVDNRDTLMSQVPVSVNIYLNTILKWATSALRDCHLEKGQGTDKLLQKSVISSINLYVFMLVSPPTNLTQFSLTSHIYADKYPCWVQPMLGEPHFCSQK